jgi:hypothetical protein
MADIDRIKKLGRANQYSRPQDSYNILSGAEKKMDKVERDPQLDEREVDPITGLRRGGTGKPADQPANIRATSHNLKDLNNNPSINVITGQPINPQQKKVASARNPPTDPEASSYNVITGQPINPDFQQKKFASSRGSFTEHEIKTNLKPNEDCITFRSHLSTIRQGFPPDQLPTVGGIFLDFEYIDDISVRCPKCSQPIFVSVKFVAKGAYVTDRAIYNAAKGGHADCYYHPGKFIDSISKPEFALFKCCNGTRVSDGCQLKM